jgi:hypothetical protein
MQRGYLDQSTITKGAIPEVNRRQALPWDSLRPRRWHLTPWKKTGLLDDYTDDSGDGTSGMDILNNLITQAGNVFTSRSGGIVPRPRPGQVVSPASAAYSMGMSTNTMLMRGAGALALFLVMRKK